MILTVDCLRHHDALRTRLDTPSNPQDRPPLVVWPRFSTPPLRQAHDATPADPDRIRRENEHPGTRDWMTTNVRVDPKTKYRSPWIEGYVSKTSVRPGESITIHVSTNPPSPFLDRHSIGWAIIKGMEVAS